MPELDLDLKARFDTWAQEVIKNRLTFNSEGTIATPGYLERQPAWVGLAWESMVNDDAGEQAFTGEWFSLGDDTGFAGEEWSNYCYITEPTLHHCWTQWGMISPIIILWGNGLVTGDGEGMTITGQQACGPELDIAIAKAKALVPPELCSSECAQRRPLPPCFYQCVQCLRIFLLPQGAEPYNVDLKPFGLDTEELIEALESAAPLTAWGTVKGPGKFEAEPLWVALAYDSSTGGGTWEHAYSDDNGGGWGEYAIIENGERPALAMIGIDRDTYALALEGDSQGFIEGTELSQTQFDQWLAACQTAENDAWRETLRVAYEEAAAGHDVPAWDKLDDGQMETIESIGEPFQYDHESVGRIRERIEEVLEDGDIRHRCPCPPASCAEDCPCGCAIGQCPACKVAATAH